MKTLKRIAKTVLFELDEFRSTEWGLFIAVVTISFIVVLIINFA